MMMCWQVIVDITCHIHHSGVKHVEDLINCRYGDSCVMFQVDHWPPHTHTHTHTPGRTPALTMYYYITNVFVCFCARRDLFYLMLSDCKTKCKNAKLSLYRVDSCSVGGRRMLWLRGCSPVSRLVLQRFEELEPVLASVIRLTLLQC